MTDYEPKIILKDFEYGEHLTSLYKEVAHLSENLDPPNPFSSSITSADNLKIVVNDTNDLRFCIKHFENKIKNKEYEHVIIGDPNSFGYGDTLLQHMIDDVEIPIKYIKGLRWILVLINISDDTKLTIKNTKVQVI